MKLLIVDDEELTRTGLISSIDWDSLGITEILQADDGVNGLEMARLYKPEIILCDVRMPRMTGIAMLERLEKFLPDSIPIFMSGYSDKEYLKAAIKLKAINYIEKPLHPEEVQAAVLEAQTLYKQKLRSHRGEAIHSQEIATRLAQQLTLPPSDNNKIADLCLELGQPELLENGMNFTSVIVKLNESVEASGIFLEDLQNDISCFLEHYHLKCLFVEKRVQYLVHHIYGRNALSPTTLSAVGSYISRQYDTCGKHLIAAGNTVTDIFRVYQSYASAVILLQNCFFFPEKTFLTENSSACFHRRDRFRIPCIHRKILFPNISWPEKKNPVFSFLMSFSGIIAAITHLCLTRSVIFITSYLIHFRLPVKKISWKPNFMKSRI